MQSDVYACPVGIGKKWLVGGPAAWVLGNWQLSGVLTLMTGTAVHHHRQRQQPQHARRNPDR